MINRIGNKTKQKTKALRFLRGCSAILGIPEGILGSFVSVSESHKGESVKFTVTGIMNSITGDTSDGIREEIQRIYNTDKNSVMYKVKTTRLSQSIVIVVKHSTIEEETSLDVFLYWFGYLCCCCVFLYIFKELVSFLMVAATSSG